MLFEVLLVVIVLFALVGCAPPPYVDEAGRPPQVLELRQDVAIPEGRARVFIQSGRIVSSPDEFTPHCALEIRHLSGPPRTVPSGIYPVTRIQQVMTEVVLVVPSRQLAQVSVGIGIRFGGASEKDTSPSDIFEGYHFWLADSANVGLMRLTCFGARDMPAEAEPPTLADLRRALGSVGRLTH